MSDEIEEHGIYEAYRILFNRNARLVAALEKAKTYSGALNYMRAPEFIRLIDEALAQ